MKNIIILLLAFTSAGLLFTCAKEDDKLPTNISTPPAPSGNGETNVGYYQIERIKHLFPTIDDAVTKAIFKNEDNDVKEFSLLYSSEVQEQSGGTGIEEHKSETFSIQYYLGGAENVYFTMSVNLYSTKSVSSEQVVEILYGKLYPASTNDLTAYFDIVDTDIPAWPTYSTYEESKTLLDKSFANVYTSIDVPTDPVGFNRIYFNPEFGIIGYTDEQGDLWVYDRME